MPHNSGPQLQPRTGMGTAALVLAGVALVSLAVSVLGVFLAAPCAALSLIFGLGGLTRVEEGTTADTAVARAGAALGLVSTIIVIVFLAGMIGPIEIN